MTIASEIERLQLAKTNIKAAIEWKWVSVPSDAKLDSYPNLISQIKTDTWLDLFVPASLTMEDVISNSNASVAMTENIHDMVSPDGNSYYHYFWFRNSWTTAHDARCVWVFKKVKWANPTFNYWSALDEWNYYYNIINRNVLSRMKIENWNVKASTLALRQYDSNGTQSHWWKVTATLYCVNMTDNTIWSIVTLWSVWNLDDKYYYNYTIIPDWDALRTASCWITAEESIGSIWLTSISFSRGSSSNRYNLTATLIT